MYLLTVEQMVATADATIRVVEFYSFYSSKIVETLKNQLIPVSIFVAHFGSGVAVICLPRNI